MVYQSEQSIDMNISEIHLSLIWRIGKFFVIPVFFLFSFSPTSQGNELVPNAVNDVPRGVVFTAKAAKNVSKRYPFLKIPPPYWTPKPIDVAPIEEMLIVYLKTMRGEPSNETLMALPNYKRQYLGYTDKGKRWILVNGLCETYWSRNKSWRTEWVVMFDGGACFFQARYNVETKQFIELEFGGES